MKNAIVLVHHLGDDGVVDEGMILTDVATKRFDTLEKSGLIREATAEEVKAGYQPKIDKDESGGKLADDPENKAAAAAANKAK
jgi:hypothetical protein